MRTVTIEVTQECIQDGLRGSCTYCPIAVAIIRELKCPIFEFEIERRGIYRDGDLCMNHTKETKKFMVDFDRGIAVEPFTFELDLP